MSNKPIFVATHPRAVSTAFERVFMTRRDVLKTVHEPFGDAYYYGPERLGKRWEDDEEGRLSSGFSGATYRTILDSINQENAEGKRLFIKDMAQYLIPPGNRPTSIAPSLWDPKRGVGTGEATNGTASAPNGSAIADDDDGSVVATRAKLTRMVSDTEFRGERRLSIPYDSFSEKGNPTVVPQALIEQFHYAFLIRHPKNSVPSYYRCTIPPLDDMTGFHYYRRDEAGYIELRQFFDYLRSIGCIGPEVVGQGDAKNGEVNGHGTNGVNGVNGVNGTNGTNGTNGVKKGVPICVIDADDLLDHPDQIIPIFCSAVGIEYSPKMLVWNSEEEQQYAINAFEKWKGFHEDAINSKDLRPRERHEEKSDEQYYADWVKKFGEDGAKLIKQSVEENVADYEYLKQFAVKLK